MDSNEKFRGHLLTVKIKSTKYSHSTLNYGTAKIFKHKNFPSSGNLFLNQYHKWVWLIKSDCVQKQSVNIAINVCTAINGRYHKKKIFTYKNITVKFLHKNFGIKFLHKNSAKNFCAKIQRKFLYKNFALEFLLFWLDWC